MDMLELFSKLNKNLKILLLLQEFEEIMMFKNIKERWL